MILERNLAGLIVVHLRILLVKNRLSDAVHLKEDIKRMPRAVA